ncbi:hypothetical protein [Pseudomonas sp. RL]|uniref:hypothetical protein n=1 Tax=Pseudomonas sp. RL TaxID=1452718 RepID=UPI000691960F|nr:hypothetical protein [Pseudomonas sp. RL]
MSELPRRQPTLLAVASIAWLAFISALVLIDYVAWTNSTDPALVDARMGLFEGRLDALDNRFGEVQQQPPGVEQAHYESDRQTLERRLAVIEQALAERLPASELAALQVRLEALEARPQPQPAPAAMPRTRTVAVKRPPLVEPAFRVMGLEWRGGERFVSLLPSDSGVLSRARLLLIGEEEGGWRLEAIEADHVIFRKAGAVRRLPIPGR